jgi:cation diffusion facilitator family transporter
MVYGSIERLFRPEVIHYQDALLIALLGQAVNLISGRILGQAHHHDHDPGRGHNDPHGHHQDLNLKLTYVHVITDAATSVAAIAALAGGWLMGWSWLDPVMGPVGAVVVALWAKCLIADTSKVLLDREMDHPAMREMRDVIAEYGAASEALIADLHVWRVGKGSHSCALSVVTHDAQLTPQQARPWLAVHEEIVHSTIEIHRLQDG